MVAAPFPARIGRYELLVPIASGGMATVYLARLRASAGFDRLVALKRIHPHLREDPAFVLDFLDEARLAGRIHHPNVVSVLDAEDDAHGPYLVMDYVEGDSLASLERMLRASGTYCDPGIALRILDDALTGLHAAHELRGDDGRVLGVVHRDFSPQNILVGTDGHSRLTDFGIAKAAAHGGRTRTGHIKGKIAYMPPEQLRGQKVDRRADVWAAGVVAWELFANRRFFDNEGGDELAMVMSVVEGKITSLRDVRPDLPVALEDAISSALERDPAERCPSAAELKRRIARAATALGTPASAADVGAWVRRLAGEKLERRTKDAKSANRTRVEQPDIETRTESPASSEASSTAKRPRSRARAALLVGVLGTAIGVPLVLARDRFARKDPTHTAPTAASTGDSAASAETELDSSAPASATSSAAMAPPTMVSISADAPMREVHIGERVIPLARPVNALAIEVTATERAAHAAVVAVGIDGRTADAELSEKTTAVAVTFTTKDASARPSTHRKPPGPPPATTKTAPATTKSAEPGESLLPSPYPGTKR